MPGAAWRSAEIRGLGDGGAGRALAWGIAAGPLRWLIMSSRADVRSTEEIRKIGIEALAEASDLWMPFASCKASTWGEAIIPRSALMCSV